MGQKINPISLRININRNFDSCWFEDNSIKYSNLLHQDLSIRKYLKSLFNYIGIHTGRITLQFFQKKLIIHYFFYDSNGYTVSNDSLDRLNRQNGLRSNPNSRSGFETASIPTNENRSTDAKHSIQSTEWFAKQSKLTISQSILNPFNSIEKNLSFILQNERSQLVLNKNFFLRVFFSHLFSSQNHNIFSTKQFIKCCHEVSGLRGWKDFYFLDDWNAESTESTDGKNRLRKYPNLSISSIYPNHLFNGLDAKQPNPNQTNQPMQSNQIDSIADGLKTKSSNHSTHDSVDLSINNLQKKRVSFTIDKNLSNIEYNISKFVQLNNYEVSILPLKMKSRFQSAPLICEYICQKLQENIGFRQIFKQLCQEMKNESLMSPLRGLSPTVSGKNSFKPNEEIQGMRILCAGRLNGVEMARVEFKKLGQTSLHVFSSKIDYGSSNAYTLQGLLGVKVWLCYR